MSEIAIDRGSLLPDPFAQWYRERPFQIAFAASVLIHALLILFVPSLRSVQIEPVQVLNVELVAADRPPVVQQPAPQVQPLRPPGIAPTAPPPPVERQAVQPEPVVEPPPAVELRQPDVVPPPRAELAPPLPRPAPREEPMTRSRPEPQPEHRVEIPVQQKPLPQAPPTVAPPPPVVRTEPEQKLQPPPRVEPEVQRLPPPVAEPVPTAPKPVPPLARIEPQPAEQIPPRVEPRPEAVTPPLAERPSVEPPAPRPAPPVVADPEPVLPSAPISSPRQTPPPVASAPTPAPSAPVTAPVPPAAKPDGASKELTVAYSQELSSQIKRYQKYPPIAQRRGWEGTAEVVLKVAADGRVMNIALGRSTGREILDKEALEMVRRATPLPKAPQALRGKELTVTVPIVFRLQDS
jgi:protein TonB